MESKLIVINENEFIGEWKDFYIKFDNFDSILKSIKQLNKLFLSKIKNDDTEFKLSTTITNNDFFKLI